MSGYIKLYRSARGTAIAQHPEYFAAWVHLLLMATHKAHDQVVGTKVVKLKPGQLVFGRQKFSANTGISENKVRSALGVMKELGMITSKSHAKFSVITITKWSEYQGESPADNQQATSMPPASNHKQECIKKGKNEQEIPPISPKGESVPFSEIFALYHNMLPELPPAPNQTEKRKKNISQRWRETVKVPSADGFKEWPCNDLEFWKRFFNRVRNSPHLMGENERGWQANLEWITKKENFYKIIEGNYVREK